MYISNFELHAYDKVGRENQVLRHSVQHFPPNSGGIASDLKNANNSIL